MIYVWNGEICEIGLGRRNGDLIWRKMLTTALSKDWIENSTKFGVSDHCNIQLETSFARIWKSELCQEIPVTVLTWLVVMKNYLMIWSLEYLIIWREVFGELLAECKLTSVTTKRALGAKLTLTVRDHFIQCHIKRPPGVNKEWKVTRGKDPLNGFHCKKVTSHQKLQRTISFSEIGWLKMAQKVLVVNVAGETIRSTNL